MKTITKIILFASLIVSYNFRLGAQPPISAVSQQLNRIAIPSPTVSGILNFTDIPVSPNTGTPDIAIPIYTVKSGNLSMPIVLKYSGTGIKVNENSGNVGLGWTLMAEGIISQTVLGEKDNSTYQEYGLNWIAAALLPNTTDNYNLLDNLSNHNQDGAPDLYTFNFPGHSGKFINADQIRLLPEQNLDISTYNNIDNKLSWKVVDESGVQYYFDAIENTANRAATSISRFSTWYLTKMVDADGVDSITFEYQDTRMDPEIGRSYDLVTWKHTGQIGGPPSTLAGFDINNSDVPIPGTLSTYVSHVSGKQLKKINFRNGTVEYDIAWNDRQDFTTELQVPRLKGIFVKNANGEPVYSAMFQQDYFVTAGENTPIGKRMRLTSVMLPPNLKYTFTYNNTSFPVKISNAIDHWGYYNGANNPGLIPPVVYPELQYNFGADRNTNPIYATAGMLSRIDYPTGGYAQFNFGPHIKLLQPYIDYNEPSLNVHFTNPFTGTVAPFWGFSDWTLAIPDNDSFNDITASFSSEAFYPQGSTSEFITHASTTVYLVEVGGDTLKIQHFAFSPTGNYTKTDNDIHLERGKQYKITTYTQGAGCGMSARLTYRWPHPGNTVVPVGCCRINSIKLHDTFTHQDVIKNYSYSTAILFKDPIYYQEIHKFFDPTPDGDPAGQGGVPPVCDDYPVLGLILSSNSIWNINAPISYDNVDEYFGSDEHTSYEYLSNANTAAYQIPFTWRMGRLKSKKQYSSSGQLVHETDYSNKRIQTHLFAGHTATNAGKHPCSYAENPNNYPVFFNQNVYSFPIDWLYVDTIKDIDYPSGITKLTINQYDNPQHKEVTRVIKDNSDGSIYTTHLKYPTDYTLAGTDYSGVAAAIKQLQITHQDNIPIEQYTTRTLGSTTTTVNASYTQFGTTFFHNKLSVIPSEQFVLSIASPVSNFQSISISGNTLTKDSRYQSKIKMSRYDDRDNVIEDLTPGDNNASYIWAYDKQYPIARTINAIANHNAFTSFETLDEGNWSFSHAGRVTSQFLTGTCSYNLNAGSVTFQKPPTGLLNYLPSDTISGNYIVSYWKKTGTVTVDGAPPTITGPTINGWTYCEHLLADPVGITVNGNIYIDELRFYPKDALMESYTYDPLIGITSYDDGKNQLLFYEYDSFNRLIAIKDSNGKIIKNYTYQYQGAQ